MSQYPWTLAEVMPPTTGVDKEMAIGDKGEDLPPEGMYPPQDTEAPPDASTVEKRDTMHVTAPRRSSYLVMKENKPTSSTWKKKESRTMKCRMPKNQIQWHQSAPNWNACPLKTRCTWQKKWEFHRIFPWPN